MKKINHIGGLLLLSIAALFLASSCKQADKPHVNYDRYKLLNTANTTTDKWIDEHLLTPYNLQVIWRYDDKETDYGYNIVPPRENNVVPFLNVYKKVFIESYIEVFKDRGVYKDDADFIRTYIPKQIHLLGEYAYEAGGTIKLGQAEGGRKIILYGINYWNDPNRLHKFMETVFHEFSHILHQTKLYGEDFEKITPSFYTGNWYNPTDDATRRIKESREQGFVSDYARKNKDEDFVETLTFYLLLSNDGWNALINGIDGSIAGDKARKEAEKALGKKQGEKLTDEEIKELDKIKEAKARDTAQKAQGDIWTKLNFVATYLKSSWDIDIDHLKSIVQRRYNEVIASMSSTPSSSSASVMTLREAIDHEIVEHGIRQMPANPKLYECCLGAIQSQGDVDVPKVNPDSSK